MQEIAGNVQKFLESDDYKLRKKSKKQQIEP